MSGLFPNPLAPSAYTDASQAAQNAALASGPGAALVGYLNAGAGAVQRTLQDKARDAFSVKDFGAIGNGIADDAPAINLAIAAAVAAGASLVFPAGTYSVLPATAQAGAANYNCAFAMLSNLHCVGLGGATIKVADNYSTDAAPKELAIFSTAVAVSNVSFAGLTFDLNGVNNKMSPARPVTYAQFNHAAIMADGPNGKVTDCVIEDCVFKNTAGVCFVVCALVAANTAPTLGLRWTIKNNLFINGGSDTNDHTSVYAFCESVLAEGNTFWQDLPPHTVGLTGGATCFEIHGSNSRFIGNYCFNYTLGLYVASNFSNTTLNVIVSGNHFYCSNQGVILYRGTSMTEIDGVLIAGNSFYFDNYTYAGQPSPKTAVTFQGQIATQQHKINNVKISGNYAIATGIAVTSQFVRWDTVVTLAGEVCSNLSITDNQVIGFTDGVYIVTNAANGQGLTEISRNQFIGLTPDAALNPPHGIYVNAGGEMTTLVIDANQFVDERGAPSFAEGIYLNSGTIATLAMGQQVFKGMTGNFLTFTGGLAVTNYAGDGHEVCGITAGVTDGGAIVHSAKFAGLNPSSLNANGSVAGEALTITSYTNTNFVVGIKKWPAGVLTAGTAQTVYWRVRFC